MLEAEWEGIYRKIRGLGKRSWVGKSTRKNHMLKRRMENKLRMGSDESGLVGLVGISVARLDIVIKSWSSQD